MSISAPDSITEGGTVSYTLTRTWDPGQSWKELSVNVALAQTGDYITWPTAHQPDADGLVTIPVTFAARSLTATLTLETVDDEVSEADGSVTATILADTSGSYVTGADSDHTTRLLDNDPPIISVVSSLRRGHRRDRRPVPLYKDRQHRGRHPRRTLRGRPDRR